MSLKIYQDCAKLPGKILFSQLSYEEQIFMRFYVNSVKGKTMCDLANSIKLSPNNAIYFQGKYCSSSSLILYIRIFYHSHK